MKDSEKFEILMKMSQTDIVSYMLNQNMNSSDMSKLQATAEVALKRLPKTKHYRSRLKDAFLKLAEHYKSEKYYYEYVKALRQVLHVAPGDVEAINDQINAFQLLLDEYGQDYIKKDFEYLEFVIELLRAKYNKGKYSKKVREQTGKILLEIEPLKSIAPVGAESKHTFQIKQLIAPFTLGLTKEQIDGIVDALVPYIPELIEELERINKDKDKE